MRKLVGFLSVLIVFFSMPLSSLAWTGNEGNPMIELGSGVVNVNGIDFDSWTQEALDFFFDEYMYSDYSWITVYSSRMDLFVIHNPDGNFMLDHFNTLSRTDGATINGGVLIIYSNGSSIFTPNRSGKSFEVGNKVMLPNFFTSKNLTVAPSKLLQYSYPQGVGFFDKEGDTATRPDPPPDPEPPPEPEPEPESEPDPPPVPIPPPVIEIPVIPTIDSPYVPYDTSIWNWFIEKILGDISALTSVGLMLFGILLAFYLIRWIVHAFTR